MAGTNGGPAPAVPKPPARLPPLDAREVTIGDTHFKIEKLLPEEALEVFEHISPGIATALERIDPRAVVALAEALEARQAGDVRGSVAAVLPSLKQALQAYLMIPATDKVYLRAKLFPHIAIRHPKSDVSLPLAGNEHLAFEGGEASHILQIAVRAFWVNFRGSFSDLASLAG